MSEKSAMVIRRKASAFGQTQTQKAQQDNSSFCPRCAASFTCGVVVGGDTCWCATLPPLTLAKSSAACYCPQCLAELLSAQAHPG